MKHKNNYTPVFVTFIKLTLTSNSFGRDLVHLTAGRYHSHCQLVDHHNAPFDPFVRPFFHALLFYDLVHDLCDK